MQVLRTDSTWILLQKKTFSEILVKRTSELSGKQKRENKKQHQLVISDFFLNSVLFESPETFFYILLVIKIREAVFFVRDIKHFLRRSSKYPHIIVTN